MEWKKEVTRGTDDQEFEIEAREDVLKSLVHEPSMPDELLAEVVEEAIFRFFENAQLVEPEEE